MVYAAVRGICIPSRESPETTDSLAHAARGQVERSGGRQWRGERELAEVAAGPVLTGAATSSGPAAKLCTEHLAASDPHGDEQREEGVRIWNWESQVRLRRMKSGTTAAGCCCPTDVGGGHMGVRESPGAGGWTMLGEVRGRRGRKDQTFLGQFGLAGYAPQLSDLHWNANANELRAPGPRSGSVV